MNSPKVDLFARQLSTETIASVRGASVKRTAQRVAALACAFEDVEEARRRAAAIKDDALERLPELLAAFEVQCRANGIVVHHAVNGDEACRIAVEICRSRAQPGAMIAKAKSMATEEIHLNAALEAAGYRPIETDLGEYVVQLDRDTPSHIVTPIIHKNRRQVAETFAAEGLGPYTESPDALTMQARAKLRAVFQSAPIGISGVNFGIAETGRLVMVSNEGNNRFSTTAPKVHIAVMGIEKLIPSESDLPLFLSLLAGSATGQRLTVYTHLVSGPRRQDETDGPDEVHLILLDNGRSRVREGPYRAILRCIRCGACLNACPVYRQVSGHAYRNVYPGPIGAVLGPVLEGLDKLGDLAKASTLCGECEEVCPVMIPIPDMLVQLRRDAVQAGLDPSSIPWKWFGIGATDAAKWRTGIRLLPLAERAPNPMTAAWSEFREPPRREGRDFRSWWAARPAPDIRPRFGTVKSAAAALHEAPPAPGDPWAQFVAMAESVQVEFAEALDLRGQSWIADEDARDIALSLVSSGRLWLDLEREVGSPWDAQVGLTLADRAVAETGSLVIGAAPGRRRLNSLAPERHVALLHPKNVVPTLESLWTDDPPLYDRTTVLITGPSRTADIEGVLVHGVHGPRSVTVLRLD